MLNRAKLLEQLETFSEQLFCDLSPEIALAYKIFNGCKNDSLLDQKIAACRMDWPLPLWKGPIDQTCKVGNQTDPYQLLSVDGSQVYPDKHQGTSCFLINIGTVELHYSTGQKGISLDSKPYLFTQDYKDLDFEVTNTTDFVNAKREELEFLTGLEKARQMRKKTDAPLLFLFDGSLIFWHLASKDEQLKKHFLKKYFQLLQEYQKENIWIAGYISMPKSKDLINVIRTVLCNFNSTSKEHEKISHLTDSSLAPFFLKPGEYSGLFKSQSPIVHEYPDSVAPHFLYADIKDEIVRVELPAYLAVNSETVASIMSIIFDQTKKGGGFPVSVAEAHEQAVVKNNDRLFFYYLIEKIGMYQKKRIVTSQKSRKKKAIAV